MAVGCPFITCAIKRKGIEFCWECEETERCEKWKKHREAGKRFDSFKCYQKLEDNIAFIQKNGVEEFQSVQKIREELLKEMLKNFNEGRSKSYFCIAATVLEIEELEKAVNEATEQSTESSIKEKSEILHSLLNEIAVRKNLLLKLRK